MIAQGDVWWADLPAPTGSTAGFRRPVIVVQGEVFNRSRIKTVVCVPLTSNVQWAQLPGNLRLSAAMTHLPKASIAQLTLILAVDRARLRERVGQISASTLVLLLAGIDAVLGRE